MFTHKHTGRRSAWNLLNDLQGKNRIQTHTERWRQSWRPPRTGTKSRDRKKKQLAKERRKQREGGAETAWHAACFPPQSLRIFFFSIKVVIPSYRIIQPASLVSFFYSVCHAVIFFSVFVLCLISLFSLLLSSPSSVSISFCKPLQLCSFFVSHHLEAVRPQLE